MHFFRCMEVANAVYRPVHGTYGTILRAWRWSRWGRVASWTVFLLSILYYYHLTSCFSIGRILFKENTVNSWGHCKKKHVDQLQLALWGKRDNLMRHFSIFPLVRQSRKQNLFDMCGNFAEKVPFCPIFWLLNFQLGMLTVRRQLLLPICCHSY